MNERRKAEGEEGVDWYGRGGLQGRGTKLHLPWGTGFRKVKGVYGCQGGSFHKGTERKNLRAKDAERSRGNGLLGPTDDLKNSHQGDWERRESKVSDKEMKKS